MAKDEKVPSEEEEGDYQFPTQNIPEDEVVPSEGKEVVERIPSTYKTLYDEICLFRDSEEIVLFNKRYHQVSVTVCLETNEMHPVNYVFDIGMGPM